MRKGVIFCLTGACLLFGALLALGADPTSRQPVFIVLYSRFYDHSHPRAIDERLERLLNLLDRMHSKYPQSGISALLQFSGTTSQLVKERNAQLHLLDRAKDFERRGVVELGYTGEDEPSYINRPKANILLAETPEARWKAKEEVAEHFLSDFKDPVTGQPIKGLTGGLKLMQDVFGNAAFIAGANPTRFATGGDTPVTYAVRKLNETAVMVGLPPPDSRRGIEGYGVSAATFSKGISPETQDSPEVFWQDNILRLSDTSLSDNRPHSTNEDLDALKGVLQKLDRSRVRVIKLEVASYLRYLAKRADGSVINDPMEWIYYHPDDPSYPITLKMMVTQTEIEAGYQKEEKTLQWLAEDFLPANPGSRFLSVRELAKMAAGPIAEPEVSVEEIKALSADIDHQFALLPMATPNFARSSNRFYSLAESFQVLAQALAVADKTGSLPSHVKLTKMYGPLEIPDNNMGLTVAEFTVAEVMHAAAQFAPQIANTAWKTVPDNSVPVWTQIGDKKVNASQFLRLMAQSCLDPARDKVLKINAVRMFSTASFVFPKNTAMPDNGLSWTWKPAPLNLEGSGSSAAGE